MPQDDYHFNTFTALECVQQEFYATGLWADALSVYLAPGFEANLQTLQIDSNSFISVRTVDMDAPQVFAQMSGNSAIVPEQQLAPDVPWNPHGDTQNYGQIVQFVPPTLNPFPSNQINGQWLNKQLAFNLGEFTATPSFRFFFGGIQSTTNPDQVFDVNYFIELLARAHDANRIVQMPRTPGLFQDWGIIAGDFLVELPALYLARLRVTTFPDNVSSSGGALQQLYRAGRVCWGHK